MQKWSMRERDAFGASAVSVFMHSTCIVARMRDLMHQRIHFVALLLLSVVVSPLVLNMFPSSNGHLDDKRLLMNASVFFV